MIRRLRKHRLLAFALVCAALTVVLALLAADVSAWQTTVSRDDLRFRAQPTHGALWNPVTNLPGDPASALVGTSKKTATTAQTSAFANAFAGDKVAAGALVTSGVRVIPIAIEGGHRRPRLKEGAGIAAGAEGRVDQPLAGAGLHRLDHLG